jgi:hypothetical protein
MAALLSLNVLPVTSGVSKTGVVGFKSADMRILGSKLSNLIAEVSLAARGAASFFLIRYDVENALRSAKANGVWAKRNLRDFGISLQLAFIKPCSWREIMALTRNETTTSRVDKYEAAIGRGN